MNEEKLTNIGFHRISFSFLPLWFNLIETSSEIHFLFLTCNYF